MTAYIARRLLMGLIVLIIVTLFVFLIMRLLPGDPLNLFLSQGDTINLTSEQTANLMHEYGLDKSLAMQYIDWLGGVVLHGNLGYSIFNSSSVTQMVKERLPITAYLGIISILISGTLGILFGVICALKRGKWQDTLFTVLANLGITLPGFWVGILLIYLFSLKLGWLPTFGFTSPLEDFSKSMRQIIMPVFCLSLFGIASLTRQTRSSMLEVIRQDYIRTAWAKGLRERMVIMRHTIKNALIPVVTTLGMHVSLIIGGSVLIESVFSIPGMGRMMRDAVFSQDYQVVQGGVLIIAVIIVITNIVVDISYGWFDPRIRYS